MGADPLRDARLTPDLYVAFFFRLAQAFFIAAEMRFLAAALNWRRGRLVPE